MDDGYGYFDIEIRVVNNQLTKLDLDIVDEETMEALTVWGWLL